MNSELNPNATDAPQGADATYLTDDNWYYQWRGGEIVTVLEAVPQARNIGSKDRNRPDLSASRGGGLLLLQSSSVSSIVARAGVQ